MNIKNIKNFHINIKINQFKRIYGKEKNKLKRSFKKEKDKIKPLLQANNP